MLRLPASLCRIRIGQDSGESLSAARDPRRPAGMLSVNAYRASTGSDIAGPPIADVHERPVWGRLN